MLNRFILSFFYSFILLFLYSFILLFLNSSLPQAKVSILFYFCKQNRQNIHQIPWQFPFLALHGGQKDYSCCHQVPDDFYQGDAWLDAIVPIFRAAKPMMDMMNAVIDDYE